MTFANAEEAGAKDVSCHFHTVYTGVEKFRNEFDVVRSTLNKPTGPLPIGAGFLGWKLEEERSSHVALLELALESGVRAIWLSFGEDLGRWIELVRNHDQKTGKSPKTLVFVQVNSVDDALTAVQTWKVDVLVAQGKFMFFQTLGPDCVTHCRHRHMSLLTPSTIVSYQASNRADMVQLSLHLF